MSRLPRPSVPASLKVEVALRQLRALTAPAATLERTEKRIGDYLERLLFALQVFMRTSKKLELHHRPAILNREKIVRDGKIVGYKPDANDPAFLFFVPEDDHDTETRVRGLHGQHSDLALARKLKRIAKKRDNRPPKGVAFKAKARKGPTRFAKRKIPSRPFQPGRKFNPRRAP